MASVWQLNSTFARQTPEEIAGGPEPLPAPEAKLQPHYNPVRVCRKNPPANQPFIEPGDASQDQVMRITPGKRKCA
jgi:hypothetical protein